MPSEALSVALPVNVAPVPTFTARPPKALATGSVSEPSAVFNAESVLSRSDSIARYCVCWLFCVSMAACGARSIVTICEMSSS